MPFIPRLSAFLAVFVSFSCFGQFKNGTSGLNLPTYNTHPNGGFLVIDAGAGPRNINPTNLFVGSAASASSLPSGATIGQTSGIALTNVSAQAILSTVRGDWYSKSNILYVSEAGTSAANGAYRLLDGANGVSYETYTNDNTGYWAGFSESALALAVMHDTDVLYFYNDIGWPYSATAGTADTGTLPVPLVRYGTNTHSYSYYPSFTPIPNGYFEMLVRNMCLSNTSVKTLAGLSMPTYWAGDKTGYQNEYLRDLVLTAQATNVMTHTQLWVRAYVYQQNRKTNAIPDLTFNTNTFTLGTIGQSTDSQAYYAFLLHLGYEKAVQEELATPARIFTTFFNTLTNGMATVSHSNSLVYMHGEKVGWGFHDNFYISKTGHVAMESLLEYAAYGKIAEMAYAAGTTEYTNVAIWAVGKMQPIIASLTTNLYDANVGLFKVCTYRTNYDLCASAFALHCGITNEPMRTQIANAFVQGYYGGTNFLAGNGFFQHGRLRMFPRREIWIDDPFPGRAEFGKQYQFGAYWPFGGWGMDALAAAGRTDLAGCVRADFYNQIVRDNECWEWTNDEFRTQSWPNTQNSRHYLATPGTALHYGRKEFVLPWD